MNLLTDPLVRFETRAGVVAGSLPELYAALVADRVDSIPALRPHQVPAWHMFLVQLGAIAMQRGGLAQPSQDAETWLRILRALTQEEFPGDEPWCLVVADETRPAFLQPPVPEGLELKTEIATPDELDMVITAKNHDLKQAVAKQAGRDDWLFSLASLQTCEGYGGGGGGLRGIARMNGGSSSRVLLGLVPMLATSAEATHIRPGQWLRRDVEQLVARRRDLLDRVPGIYTESGGCALTWTIPWPEGEQLALGELDIFFIEVCRRVRLVSSPSGIAARAGTSKAARINAKVQNGVLGDPWAPVNITQMKSLSLTENGDFDYLRIIDLMLSAEWRPPLLAELGPGETAETANWQLVAQAFARGNSKTGGFKTRFIPLKGRVARGLGIRRPELHDLAKNQVEEIDAIEKILRDAIALAAAGGDRDEVDESDYAKSRPARKRLKAQADRLFFPALWERFEAQESGGTGARLVTRKAFVVQLADIAEELLDEALADLPCPSIRRPRAEARARSRFRRGLHRQFPDCFSTPRAEEDVTDAA